MKTIGLIGGMSWESTIPYYQIINEGVKAQLGGLHSAKIILHSVEFDEIEKCQSRGDWKKSGEILGKAAQGLEADGADFSLICTNPMHKVAPQLASMIHIPIIHIADAPAAELLKHTIPNVGLLGTHYHITQDFYTQKLEAFAENAPSNTEGARRSTSASIPNLRRRHRACFEAKRRLTAVSGSTFPPTAPDSARRIPNM